VSDLDPAPSTPAGRDNGVRRYRAPIVLGLVGVLITGSLAAVAGPAPDRSSPLVSTYVPADGTVQFARQESTIAGRRATATIMTESARITGSAMLNALDWNLATRVIGALDSDRDRIDRSRFWRTISTQVSPVATSSQAAQTRVYTLDADIALAAESGPGLGFSYLPNLVELPAGVQAGQTWRSSGTAGAPTIRYTSEFAARAGAAECLEVTGTVTYSVETTSLTRKLGRTWCPGGLIRESDDWVGTAVLRTAEAADPARSGVAPAALPAAVTAQAAARWDPARWRPARHEVVSVDPNYGEGPMAGTPGSLPPVATRSGLIVQATASVPDLVAIGPDPAGRWRSQWRVHPGGEILTVSAFGDMIVVTTASRRVVGYDSRGIRRWTISTREVVRAQPVRTSTGTIAIATLDGEVLAVQVATGSVRWRTRVPGDVRLTPAATPQELAVIDGSGTLTGLDLVDGRQRWTADVDLPVALAATSSGLAVLSESTVGAYEIRGGTNELTWRRWFPGGGRAVVAAADSVVARTQDEVLAFDGAGSRRWARPGSAVSTDGRLLVVWGAERAEVLDASGRVVTSFTTPAESAGNPHRHLATEGGVLLFDSTWTFSGWTDG
jgi:outer membrane protein assembly factor BamB